MATFKLSINRGERAEDAVVAAGSAITGNDGIELNIDTTVMSKSEALIQIDELKKRIHQSTWPIATS